MAVDGEGKVSWEARRDMATGRDEHGCSQVDSKLIENLESDFRFSGYTITYKYLLQASTLSNLG